MKFKFLITIFLISITPLIQSCNFVDHSINNSDEIVVVSINESEKFDVISKNPLKVAKGTDAHFKLLFHEGYQYQKCNNDSAIFKNNILTIPNVLMPNSFDVFSMKAGHYKVEVINDESKGSVSTNLSSNIMYVDSGFELSLECKPLEKNSFTCWTIDKPVQLAMPFSFNEKENIIVESDISIIANYYEKTTANIMYHGNGGFSQCGKDKLLFNHVLNNHLRPNTLQGTKLFIRNGYMLDSWNTMPDGTGDRIGLGSRVSTNKENVLHLYAIWLKETDESYFSIVNNDKSECYIKSCISQEEKIVIPKIINGKTVVGLKANSFLNLPFKDIHLPLTCRYIEDNALKDCIFFENIYFYDDLIEIGDKFSNIMPNKIFINACVNPSYTGYTYQAIFADKVDLLFTMKSEKIIFVGNSNTMYSIDGSLVSERLQKDVMCFGVQSGVGIQFELAVLETYFSTDKNIVIFCPEFGSDSELIYFTEHKYYAAENNFDLLSTFNFKKRKGVNIFNSYTAYKENKSKLKDSYYSEIGYINSGMNKHGNIFIKKEPYHDNGWFSNEIDINLNYYNEGNLVYLTDFQINLKNSRFYYSCPSYNVNCIPAEKRNCFFNEFQESIHDNIDFPYISDIKKYGFTGNAFDNDNYHLLYSYVPQRTEYLIQDIMQNAQF